MRDHPGRGRRVEFGDPSGAVDREHESGQDREQPRDAQRSGDLPVLGQHLGTEEEGSDDEHGHKRRRGSRAGDRVPDPVEDGASDVGHENSLASGGCGDAEKPSMPTQDSALLGSPGR